MSNIESHRERKRPRERERERHRERDAKMDRNGRYRLYLCTCAFRPIELPQMLRKRLAPKRAG